MVVLVKVVNQVILVILLILLILVNLVILLNMVNLVNLLLQAILVNLVYRLNLVTLVIFSCPSSSIPTSLTHSLPDCSDLKAMQTIPNHTYRYKTNQFRQYVLNFKQIP